MLALLIRRSLVLAVLGLFAMIVYTFPWLGLIFIPIGAYLVSLRTIVLPRVQCQRLTVSTSSQATIAALPVRSRGSILCFAASCTTAYRNR